MRPWMCEECVRVWCVRCVCARARGAPTRGWGVDGGAGGAGRGRGLRAGPEWRTPGAPRARRWPGAGAATPTGRMEGPPPTAPHRASAARTA